jgi:hypothetical protein
MGKMLRLDERIDRCVRLTRTLDSFGSVDFGDFDAEGAWFLRDSYESPLDTAAFTFTVGDARVPMAVDLYRDGSGTFTAYFGASYSTREFAAEDAEWEVCERIATLAFYTARYV